MNAAKSLFIVLLALAAVVTSMSFFIVRQTEHAIKFRFGEIIKSDYAPGLHFKWPLINEVRKFDKRVLTLDTTPETFPTSEQKYVEVDFFVKWRIVDVSAFYRTTAGSEIAAAQRLLEVLKNGLKAEIAKRTLAQVVSAERAEIMGVMTARANAAAKDFGVEIVDVRVKQIELPTSVSEDVYKRMRSERQEFATQIRAEGAEAAEKVRADAERQRTVLLAEAFREAEEIRGAGDAGSAAIYARAYNRDAEFYGFYRSLQAYRKAFEHGNDILVLEPDSEFFKYFDQTRAR